MALKIGDYALTEAGFGADLGAEKFLDIKCRTAGLAPDAVVIVATVRALKRHCGMVKKSLAVENMEALKKGIPNLLRHVRNIRDVFHLPCVVAVNRFPTDTDAEIQLIMDQCRTLGVNAVLSNVWAEGGAGGTELAQEVIRLCESGNSGIQFCYSLEDSIEDKIQAVVQKIYGGRGVTYLPAAKKQISTLSELGYGSLPVCMAKTQYSFSDDPTRTGAPEDFEITVRNVKVSAGAGFLVILTGDIMTMPGLPKTPSAELIDVDENGRITGLF
jgi:formate--tetrahydrofolate ligase